MIERVQRFVSPLFILMGTSESNVRRGRKARPQAEPACNWFETNMCCTQFLQKLWLASFALLIEIFGAKMSEKECASFWFSVYDLIYPKCPRKRTLLVAGTGFELSCTFMKYKISFIVTTNIYSSFHIVLSLNRLSGALNFVKTVHFVPRVESESSCELESVFHDRNEGSQKPSRAVQNSFGRDTNTIFYNGNETS